MGWSTYRVSRFDFAERCTSDRMTRKNLRAVRQFRRHRQERFKIIIVKTIIFARVNKKLSADYSRSLCPPYLVTKRVGRWCRSNKKPPRCCICNINPERSDVTTVTRRNATRFPIAASLCGHVERGRARRAGKNCGRIYRDVFARTGAFVRGMQAQGIHKYSSKAELVFGSSRGLGRQKYFFVLNLPF